MTDPRWCNCEGVRCSVCTEAEEVHREVVRHLVSEVARFQAERDRALACEAAALGLVAEWRERVAALPPPPASDALAQEAPAPSAAKRCRCEPGNEDEQGGCRCCGAAAGVPCSHTPVDLPSPPPEAARCGECGDRTGYGLAFKDDCGSGRSGGSR